MWFHAAEALAQPVTTSFGAYSAAGRGVVGDPADAVATITDETTEQPIEESTMTTQPGSTLPRLLPPARMYCSRLPSFGYSRRLLSRPRPALRQMDESSASIGGHVEDSAAQPAQRDEHDRRPDAFQARPGPRT